MQNRFRHQTVPGRRSQRESAPLQERSEPMEQVMRQIHASKKFSFAEACEAVAEATEKSKVATK